MNDQVKEKRMKRQRLTARDDSGIIAEINKLENLIRAGVDEGLAQDAQAIADEEAKIVEESTGESVSEDVAQNEKLQKNWPMSATERHKLAKNLVGIAKRLIRE